ncbi:hypothetical protein MGA3_11745 [Bacillus methanolicus MGA3]|nr:hypothetical protein MGA3_11745 [Bacillus methanolicus MGA3]
MVIGDFRPKRDAYELFATIGTYRSLADPCGDPKDYET